MNHKTALYVLATVCSVCAWCWAESPKVQAIEVIENSIGMKLVLVPPGEFMMGSPETEQGRLRTEELHRVRITSPFYLGVYEVTQMEFERVMGDNPSRFRSLADIDVGGFPVESVCWDDAVEFCRRLSLLPEEQAAGRVYRLPTEAEWEYACRAGTTTPFNFGRGLNGREANCCGTLPYQSGSNGPFLRRPAPVGSYQPNALGLYDMHGNVWEWCQDWFSPEYYENAPLDDPAGPSQARYRVSRGGGWRSYPFFCRSAHRFRAAPGNATNNQGFRVAARASTP